MTGPVPSPCINICQMDADTGWCAGCLRTLDEITVWSRLPDDAKRQVWALLPLRRAQRDRLQAVPATPPGAAP